MQPEPGGLCVTSLPLRGFEGTLSDYVDCLYRTYRETVEDASCTDKGEPAAVVNVNWSSIAAPSREEVRKLSEIINKEIGRHSARSSPE